MTAAQSADPKPEALQSCFLFSSSIAGLTMGRAYLQVCVCVCYTCARLCVPVCARPRELRAFPGGPGAETPCSLHNGPGFDPWSGNQTPHAAIKDPARAWRPDFPGAAREAP